MPPVVKKNILALGLTRRFQTVYQQVSPSTANKLAKVKELVVIELVNEYKSAMQLKAERKPNPGFVLLKEDLLNKRYE